MHRTSGRFAAASLALAFFVALPAFAEDLVTYEIALKGKTFEPAEIKVPAGKPFMIKMNNTNAAPAELESKPMKIEKLAPAATAIVVRVMALEPGTYGFVDEFQEDDAKGVLIAE